MAVVSLMPCKKTKLTCWNPADSGLFFHYTSLETLWAILENETMRATQAGFSNDSKEIEIGTKFMWEVCKEYTGETADSLRAYVKSLINNQLIDIDCYIICFCDDDDILSQWRGYCRNDGVSIGFAFDKTCSNYYVANINNGKEKDIEDGLGADREPVLYPVWYLSNEENKKNERKALKEKIVNKLQSIQGVGFYSDQKRLIGNTIPLIKDAGFSEEKEHRLLIVNDYEEQGGETRFPLDKKIKYRTGTDNTKGPYLDIKFGLKEPPKNVTTLKCSGLSDASMSLLEKRLGMQVEKIEESELVGDSPQIIIGIAEDKAQQEIFEQIESMTDLSKDEPLKIWCEGHLPIRRICVSPCPNQDDVIRSIKHYCLHNKFWMKHVEVIGSKIPYRRPK